jgi:PKHD-type hydroxylase
MNYQIATILQPSQVAHVGQTLANQIFVDGKVTASGGARDVKNNLQADRETGQIAELERLISQAFFSNDLFQSFAFPKRLRSPIFSRYKPGMDYGAHVDGAIMHENGIPLRADLAATLFLSEPDTYDGGELVIQLPNGEEEIKLTAGEAIIYPANTVHHVAPVTRGTRLVAVTWVQTAVRDERMRAILFDVQQAMKQVDKKQDPMLLLSKTYHNLLRITAEF